MAKVLIVEDDAVIGRGMAAHLADAGFEPLLVGRGEVGLARLRYERPDVVVLDLMLPELDGWAVIERARGEGIGDRRRRLPRQAVRDGRAGCASAGLGAARSAC